MPRNDAPAVATASLGRRTPILLAAAAAIALALAHWGAADALLGLKVAVAVALAWAIGTAAVFRLAAGMTGRAQPLWRLAPEGLALALCVLFVLSRGAPHNNPALFGLYADFGARGLGAAGALFAALVAASGISAFRLRAQPQALEPCEQMAKPRTLGLAVAVFSALALLAALEPVLRHWDVPGWGDSIFYDWISHQIALGAMPAGHSYYMPVYQYGPAALYYLFGHFFFVQQLANLALAPVTVVLLCMSAWNIFRNPWAVLLVGALAAADDVLRHIPYLQQIENWYVPALALAVFAATQYFRAASVRNLVFLALAAGLVFELRAQAAFFSAFLLLAPLFLRDASMAKRLRHVVLLGAVFAAVLLPWTLRNYAVDGRFSPVGTQGAQHIARSNTAATFYGIRRDLAPPAPVVEGDEKSRDEAAEHTAFERVFGDPMLLIRAAPWRALAFYGLLPPGVWDKAGVRPTDWRREGPEYLLRVFPVLCLLGAGALGLLLRPGRATLFLLGTIFANLAVAFFAGFSEPRLSFPVHALHILLAGAAVFAPRLEFAAPMAQDIAPLRAGRVLAVAGGILLVAVAAHATLGRAYALRELTGRPAAYDPAVRIDASLPDLARLAPPKRLSEGFASVSVHTGERVRAVVALTNEHLPVKYYAFPLPDFPDFTADPKTPIYYRTFLIDPAGGSDLYSFRQIGIDVSGAVFDRPLHENDVVEMEGEVLGVGDTGLIWLHADTMRLLHRWAEGDGSGAAHGF